MSDKINNNNNKKGKIYQFYEISKENIKSDNYLVNKNQKKTFLTNISPNMNIVDYRMKLKELKGLKEKQNSLIKKINSVKNKKNEMNEISFNNIYKSKVDNNMRNNNIKDLNSLEKNLVDKLNDIKQQIKALDKNYNDDNLNEINEKKNKLNKNNLNFDELSIKEQLLNHNKLRMKEIENIYLNKQKEKLKSENDLRIEKEVNLKSKKEEEIEKRKKRKIENEKKMEDIKKDITPISNNNKNNLYQKMEKNFIEKENKLIHEVLTQRKIKNIIYQQNLNKENEKLDKKESNEKRAKETSDMMKKLWHSRSMILKPYQISNNNKIFHEEEIVKKENKENNKIKEMQQYSKEKVKLPPINEKLKEESEWRQIDIKNLKGKARINYVKKKYMSKGLKMLNAIQNLDFGKKYVLGKGRNLSDIRKKRNDNTSFSMANKRRRIELKKIIIKNSKMAEYNIKKRTIEPKEINYLKDIKIKKREFHEWKNFLLKKEEKKLDIEGFAFINTNIERLDEKIKMGRELIDINGGYNENKKLGKEVNKFLIDSIKGKLTILDELYNNNKEEEKDN